MSLGLLALIASIPLLTILVLVVGFRIPTTKAMPIAFVITLCLALFVWQTPLNYIGAAIIKGMGSATEILLIIFGALVLLFTLREAGALAAINKGFKSISEDRRVQVILISWFMGAFIEGVAGFGTPVALLSPLLVSLGFPALAAVLVSLIANTSAISFGAVGIAVNFGIGGPLNTPDVHQALAHAGMNYPQFIFAVNEWTAVLHGVMGIFVPLLAVSMMTKFFGKNKSFRDGLRIWPFALFAGGVYAVTFVTTSFLLGPEFPSLFAGIVGLAVVVPAAKAGFLIPKEKWDFPERSSWEQQWIGTATFDTDETVSAMPLWKAWLPYAGVGMLLIISRIDALPVKAFIKEFTIPLNNFFGTDIKSKIELLYNPGLFPFLLITLLAIPFFKMTRANIASAWKEAAMKMKDPVIALLFTVPMVELMQVGHSPQGWANMPITIAQYVSQFVQGAWPLVAPFVGALGIFIGGSNTVSNMLFGTFQYSVADRLGISHIIILSEQTVGGAFGVLVCIFKIIAASATVGLSNVEGVLIRKNLLPLLIYGLVVGITSMLLIYWIVPGLF